MSASKQTRRQVLLSSIALAVVAGCREFWPAPEKPSAPTPPDYESKWIYLEHGGNMESTGWYRVTETSVEVSRTLGIVCSVRAVQDTPPDEPRRELSFRCTGEWARERGVIA